MKHFQILFFVLPLLSPPGCSPVPVHPKLTRGEISAEEWINTLLDMEDRVVSRVLQLLGGGGELTLVFISSTLATHMLSLLYHTPLFQGRLNLDLHGFSMAVGLRSRYRRAAKRQAWDTAQSRAVIPYPRIGKRGDEE